MGSDALGEALSLRSEFGYGGALPEIASAHWAEGGEVRASATIATDEQSVVGGTEAEADGIGLSVTSIDECIDERHAPLRWVWFAACAKDDTIDVDAFDGLIVWRAKLAGEMATLFACGLDVCTEDTKAA